MHRPRQRAMTLIEMTITILLLGIALFLITGWMSLLRESSKTELAARMLADLDNALARYRRATGSYPTARGPDSAVPVIVELLDHQRTRSIIQAFPESLWSGPEAPRRLIDPWGTPLRYLAPGEGHREVLANGGRPIFVSAGPDRDFGDSDPMAIGNNMRSDDPGPEGFRLQEAIREALVETTTTSPATDLSTTSQPADEMED